jgi:hypothetical protein
LRNELAALGDAPLVVPAVTMRMAREQFQSVASECERAGSTVATVMCEIGSRLIEQAIAGSTVEAEDYRSSFALRATCVCRRSSEFGNSGVGAKRACPNLARDSYRSSLCTPAAPAVWLRLSRYLFLLDTLLLGFRKRTPAPPPFSSMNSTPSRVKMSLISVSVAGSPA